jgi:hypothetical protein
MPVELATTPSAPASGVVKAALSTTVAACALGAAYGFVVAWVPYAHLVAFVAVMAVGYAIAGVGEQTLAAGRVRHRGVTNAVILLAAAIGYYIAWVVWVATVFDFRGAVALLWSPVDLAATIGSIGDAGAWSLLGTRAGRFESWVAWITEVVLFFVATHDGAEAAARRLARPYCTRCRHWIGAPVAVHDLGFGWLYVDEYAARVVSRQWGEFEYFGVSQDPRNCHRYLIASCRCGAVKCLTVELLRHGPDVFTERKVLVDTLVLEAGEPERLQAIAQAARAYSDARARSSERNERAPPQ